MDRKCLLQMVVKQVHTLYSLLQIQRQEKSGISAFIVEKDTSGLIIGKDEHKMGLLGSRTVQLTF